MKIRKGRSYTRDQAEKAKKKAARILRWWWDGDESTEREIGIAAKVHCCFKRGV